MISILEFPVGWSIRDGQRELQFIDREQEITLGFLERLAEGVFDVGYETAEDEIDCARKRRDAYADGRSDGYADGREECEERQEKVD